MHKAFSSSTLDRKMEGRFRRKVGPRVAKHPSGCPTNKKSELPSLRLRGGLQLFVRTLSGATILLSTSETETIHDIKGQLAATTGIPTSSLRLYCRGRALRDDVTVEKCGLEAEDTLMVSIALRGGASEKEESAERENAEIARHSGAASGSTAEPVEPVSRSRASAASQAVPISGSPPESEASQSDMPPPDNWRILFPLGPTGLGTTTAQLEEKALQWAYTVLSLTDIPTVHLESKGYKSSSSGKTCNAIYLDGRCSLQCHNPECTLRVKATVWLPGHTQKTAGDGLIRCSGTHPPDDDRSGVQGATKTQQQQQKPPRITNLDPNLTKGTFDSRPRHGLANTSGALCHVNVIIQAMLTTEDCVNLLRRRTRHCKRGHCLVCKLAEVDQFTSVRTDWTREIDSLESVLKSWFAAAGVSAYSCQDATETFMKMIRSLHTQQQENSAAFSECTATTSALLELLHLDVKTELIVQRPCTCVPEDHNPLRAGAVYSTQVETCHLLDVRLPLRGEGESQGGRQLSIAGLIHEQFLNMTITDDERLLQSLRCDMCEAPEDTLFLDSRRLLDTTGRLMFVGLQRYSFDHEHEVTVQNNEAVDLDVSLTLNDGSVWTLISFSIFLRKDKNNYGHWLLYRRAPEGLWWCYDDRTVRDPVELPATARFTTNFLVYERQPTRRRRNRPHPRKNRSGDV